MLRKMLKKVSLSALTASVLITAVSILSCADETGVTVSVVNTGHLDGSTVTVGGNIKCSNFDTWLGDRNLDYNTVTPRNRSYYDSSSNTLYIDEYQNYTEEQYSDVSSSFLTGDNAALINIQSDKPMNDSVSISNPIFTSPYGATARWVNSSYDRKLNQFEIYLSCQVPEDSTVEFEKQDGSRFTLGLKKRVPITGYSLTDNAGNKASVFYNRIQSVFAVDAIARHKIKLSLTGVGSLNGTQSVLNDHRYMYNDVMLYQIKDSSGNYITGSAFKSILQESEDGKEVYLTFPDEGTYTLRCIPISVADAARKDQLREGNIQGLLNMPSYCSQFLEIPIKIKALKGIDKLAFDKTDFVLGNTGTTSVKLSDHLAIEPEDNNDTLTWSVSGDAVKVDQTGTVTAVKTGTAKVSVKALSGAVATVSFRVANLIQSIELRNKDISVPQGHSVQLDVVTRPADADEKIQFISEEPSILSVNSNGVVTALPNGNFAGDSTVVNIIVRSESGTEKIFPINVVKASNTVKFDAAVCRISDNRPNLENSLIDYGNDRYGLYNSQKLQIKLNAIGSNGKESNDTIEWRATVEGTNLKNVPLSSLGNYGTAALADYNKTLTLTTSKDSNQTIQLTAYAVDDVRGIDDPYVKRTFTIDTNMMTNKIVMVHQNHDVTAKMDLGVGKTSDDISITVYPSDSKNKDKLYLESSAPDVVKVDFNAKNNTFKLTGIQPGQADILVYATYDPSNPKTNYSYVSKMVVTAKADIADYDFTIIGLKDVTYRRSAYNQADFPELSLYYKNKKLIYKVDYEVYFKDNVNAGTAKVVFTAKGDSFTGTRTTEFEIYPYMLTGNDLETVINPVVYTGNPITPFLKNTVTALDYILSYDDYDVSYENNVNVGTADVIITGKGNFTGTVTKPFEILPRNVEDGDDEFEPIPTQTVTPIATPTVAEPTAVPTVESTATPTVVPTEAPTATPTAVPTEAPTAAPTAVPTVAPTATPAASKDISVKGHIYTIDSGLKKTLTVKRFKKGQSNISVPATVKVRNVKYKVTKIAAGAFKNNKKLKQITLGSNITTIGKEAFSGCSNLKKVTVKSRILKKVGKNAFKGINKKAVVTVPLAKQKKLFGKIKTVVK